MSQSNAKEQKKNEKTQTILASIKSKRERTQSNHQKNQLNSNSLCKTQKRRAIKRIVLENSFQRGGGQFRNK